MTYVNSASNHPLAQLGERVSQANNFDHFEAKNDSFADVPDGQELKAYLAEFSPDPIQGSIISTVR